MVPFHVTFSDKINYYEVLETVPGRGSHSDFSEKPFLFGCYTVSILEKLTDFSKCLAHLII